jgi:hypothetical protein
VNRCRQAKADLVVLVSSDVTWRGRGKKPRGGVQARVKKVPEYFHQ